MHHKDGWLLSTVNTNKMKQRRRVTTDPGSAILAVVFPDLSLSFRNACENVACVEATALLGKSSFATEKLFDSESSEATTKLLRNVVKLVASLLVATLLPNTDY